VNTKINLEAFNAGKNDLLRGEVDINRKDKDYEWGLKYAVAIKSGLSEDAEIIYAEYRGYLNSGMAGDYVL
jgi:hypothetical protein